MTKKWFLISITSPSRCLRSRHSAASVNTFSLSLSWYTTFKQTTMHDFVVKKPQIKAKNQLTAK